MSQDVRARVVALVAVLVCAGTGLVGAPSAAASTPSTTGSISGVVTAQPGVEVLTAELEVQQDGVWVAAPDLQDQNVGLDGSYTIADVPAGADYRLCFDGIAGDSLNGPVGCHGGDFPESATAVAVSSQAQTIDTTLTTEPVTVSGTVVSTSGAAAASVVTLERQVGTAWEADYTNAPDGSADGTYSFAVLPATYRIRAVPNDVAANQHLATSVSPAITVSAATTFAPQQLPAGGTITGTLSAPAGSSAAGIDVRALADGVPIMTTRARDDGTYSLTHVPTGTQLTVAAASVEDSTDLQPAVSVAATIPPAQTSPLVENLTLSRGASITGTVVGADVPEGDAFVRAWDPAGSAPSRVADVLDAAGDFVLRGLTPGRSYRISIDPRDGSPVRYLTAGANVSLSASSTGFAAPDSLGYVDLDGLAGSVSSPAVSTSGGLQVGAGGLGVSASWAASPRPTLVTYTWYVGNRVVGPSAAASSYVPTSADVGQPVSVLVTGALRGYRSSRTTLSLGTVTAQPAQTAPVVRPSLAVTGRPTLAGTAKVGKRLSARAGTATPAAAASFQWLRNGVPIARATATAYKLTKADKGKRISVRVSWIRAGYFSALATSAATTAVKK
ncbi:hypothetical protein D9V37_11935 [Nocardioides mangrovicus]|uniref:Alpha-amylase n=1 Tax=Nocardioides mangrovicus TaxID=2478913 RepID=A0A3L8P1C5_9ACTN|nr:hypothetical protein [Nocardioides mangrovicus]RLV49250.1 hypothetical protein D9V37_11935 [Nocardioides mangrovicus]